MKVIDVVIVGAGHAGFQLAAQLRQNGFQGTVKLVNGERHLPYQRPPLSKKFLASETTPQELFFRNAAYYSDQNIEIVYATAVGVDRSAKQVALSTGEAIRYDHLVLATGARTKPVIIGGITHGFAYLRNVDEAASLRGKLGKLGRLLVIGGGFIGLESAVAARGLGWKVDIVESARRVMERSVGASVSKFFADEYAREGVSLHCGASVSCLSRKGDVTEVELSNGIKITDVDLIVAGIGVAPETELAQTAELEVSEGIVVDEFLLTSDTNISAIGDCAAVITPFSSSRVRIESVQNASDQARCVAGRLCGKPEPYSRVPWFWSDQGPNKLQIVGLSHGADLDVVRGSIEDKSFSVFRFVGEKLVAIESVNRAADHMFGRRLLSMGRSIMPDAAGNLSTDLASYLK